MKVIIYDDALDVPKHQAFKLDMLVIYACEGRHIIQFESDEGQEKYLERYAQTYRDAYRDAIAMGLREDGTRPENAVELHIKKTSRSHWGYPVATVSLDDAYRVLAEPLAILVENYENDWNFLLGIVGTKLRAMLEKAEQAGWIRRVHGGGSELKKQLLERLKSPAEQWRTFALFDSDRMHPDELDPSWDKRDQQKCEGLEMEKVAREHYPQKYWMLKRRFIESYMPKKELKEHGASKIASADTVDAFFRMTPAQQWYFNMKGGFEGDDKDKSDNKGRARDLYKSPPVSETDYQHLKRGFGKSLAEHYVLMRLL
jgi:hypothetical protein